MERATRQLWSYGFEDSDCFMVKSTSLLASWFGSGWGFLRIFALRTLAAWWFVSACRQHDTGIYFLPRPHSRQTDALPVVVLANAIDVPRIEIRLFLSINLRRLLPAIE